ncbi:extensin family protein [Leucothrix arctica]|uniref:Extensin n=1 Tax=Leucothrix arctica TaxID=1481894 RepID=A0A317CHF0_9GAMM|nr:extensin family protein [Leucothrix arctica]PWQ95672.1 extensin [Leucothrix arctica]
MASGKPDKTWVSILLIGLIGFGIYKLLTHPSTPIPKAWNPTKPLAIEDDVTPFTPFKLTTALRSDNGCIDVLKAGSIGFSKMPDLVLSGACGIDDRVTLSKVGTASVKPLQTSCPIALRSAMWERHSLQPAARQFLGAEITEILHYSSYNCRRIRGSSNRWSTHATAEAIDVAGFVLSDGRKITLLKDWNNEPAFFDAIQRGACRWFKTVLGPNYNSLHRDHFHLQSVGRGTCS